MEQWRFLVETDTLGNACRVKITGMEYTDGQVDQYIKDNLQRIKEKVMHITTMLMAQSIMVSSRMVSSGERE
jgi:CO dehydrogenase/acetyl-CoA synthase gamma subunit (corrinoid Fe-S protein)